MLKKITVISLSALMLSGVLGVGSFNAFAHDNNSDKTKIEAKVQTVKSANPAVSINFGENGRVSVNGAKVTSVSGSTITATTGYGSVNFNWAVSTDGSTKFTRRAGGALVVSQIVVGDVINFSGSLNTAVASPLTVKATSVKVSTALVKTTVQGTLKSISPLVVTANGVDYTVNVSSSTAILNMFWLHSSLSSFHVGDTIRVYGNVNTNATIDATVVRDTKII